jgi:DNA-binding IclR family transcriptional regulator
MAIRKLARRGKPASIKAITTETGFPLSNVRRHTISLASMGLILRQPRGGYIINAEYPGAGLNARHVRIIVRAILAASVALQRL